MESKEQFLVTKNLALSSDSSSSSSPKRPGSHERVNMSGDFAAIQDIHGAILDAKDDDQDFMDSVGEILFGNYFLG